MTQLTKLNVSLTKHGAHKIAILLGKYDKDEILNHLWGKEPGINIESAQAKKNLSVNAAGKVPPVWNKAREQGQESINALVLIAIIFSHNDLINAMKKAAGTVPMTGTIIRGQHLDGKAFTNFAHTIEELGFSTGHSKNHVHYNLQKIFAIEGLSDLAAEILTLKLSTAGWDKKNSVQEEIMSLGFNEAFALSKERFQDWLATGKLPSERLLEDASFFLAADDAGISTPFKFSPGHKKKKTGTVPVTNSGGDSEANLLHNAIQNELYVELVAKHGEKSVGTEVPTGQGTSIDVVVNTGTEFWFYEIKTAPSAKACIRQAIPQLLEYAYWDGDIKKADRLIIVGPVPITAEAGKYLDFLRSTFSIPIYYEAYKPPMP